MPVSDIWQMHGVPRQDQQQRVSALFGNAEHCEGEGDQAAGKSGADLSLNINVCFFEIFALRSPLTLQGGLAFLPLAALQVPFFSTAPKALPALTSLMGDMQSPWRNADGAHCSACSTITYTSLTRHCRQTGIHHQPVSDCWVVAFRSTISGAPRYDKFYDVGFLAVRVRLPRLFDFATERIRRAWRRMWAVRRQAAGLRHRLTRR
jgi:hypothetical protein